MRFSYSFRVLQRNHVNLQARVRNLQQSLENLARSDYAAASSSPYQTPGEPAQMTFAPPPPPVHPPVRTESSKDTVEASTSSTSSGGDQDPVRDSFASERYGGKGSTVHLAEAVDNLLDGEDHDSGSTAQMLRVDGNRRANWAPSPVERAIVIDSQRYVHDIPLPSQGLLHQLLDLYRQNIHPYLPILHWPSFLLALSSSTQIRNPSFRALVLAVVASAACFSDDSRVLPGPDICPRGDRYDAKGLHWMLAGLHHSFRLFGPPASIHDLQFIALFVHYLRRNTSILFAWSAVSPGIRRFVDAGAHRQKSKRWDSSILLDEQRKRAWWSVVFIDKSTSCSLGRPLSIQEHDYDVALPLEISDDELEQLDRLHRLNPERPLAARNGGCYRMQAFNSVLQLCSMGSQACGILNDIRDTEDRLAFIEEKHRALVSMDSAMNAFKVSVHLRTGSALWDCWNL